MKKNIQENSNKRLESKPSHVFHNKTGRRRSRRTKSTKRRQRNIYNRTLLEFGRDKDNHDGQVPYHSRHYNHPHSHSQRQVPHNVLTGVEGVWSRLALHVVVVLGEVAAGYVDGGVLAGDVHLL